MDRFEKFGRERPINTAPDNDTSLVSLPNNLPYRARGPLCKVLIEHSQFFGMETSLPALAPERKKGYAYDIYGFRVSGILRESSAHLKAKLGPTVIGTAATVNKKWILAQLKHYGIKPNRKADRIEVEALLRKSVYGGLVSARINDDFATNPAVVRYSFSADA